MVKKIVWLLAQNRGDKGTGRPKKKSVANISQSPHKGIYFSAIKKNRVEPATTWKNLQDTLLNERTKDTKTTECMTPLT